MFHMVPEIRSITCMVFMMDSQYVYCVVPTESYSVSFFYHRDSAFTCNHTQTSPCSYSVIIFSDLLCYISIHEMNSLVMEDHR